MRTRYRTNNPALSLPIGYMRLFKSVPDLEQWFKIVLLNGFMEIFNQIWKDNVPMTVYICIIVANPVRFAMEAYSILVELQISVIFRFMNTGPGG